MSDTHYAEFLRARITELRIKKDVSERGMSLDLGRSDSYIRGITSGASLPSCGELFKIFAYFKMSPLEFFAPLKTEDSLYGKICERLRDLDEADLAKVNTLIDWLEE